MPSPLGHALAGAAVAFVAQRRVRPSWGLVLASAGAACLPDLDLLLPHAHRTVTHSVTAVAAVFTAVWLLARWLSTEAVVSAAVVAAAYASHVALDWLGIDLGEIAGVQLLWPVSETWFISPWPLFLGTERTDPLSVDAILVNAQTALWEVMVLVPVLMLSIRQWRRLTASRR